jgi:catechol 2,3-dioxygenase-like lactoylglutathione lyase family enzyme
MVKIDNNPAHDPHPADVDAEGPARELRVAVTVDDFEAGLRFYRDVLGLPVVEAWDQPHGRRGVVLAAGRATLELLSPAQTELVDQVEIGDPPASRPAQPVRPTPPVRLAIEVGDSAAAGEALVAGGAELLGGPVVTPWQHRNVRLRAPDGMQLTLFTVLDTDDPEGSPP